ncbi:MAG: metallophosphoesterase [Pseudomonadota bacterium]
MARFIWLSDLHYLAEGLVQGHDPRVRLQAAISLINAHYSDAGFVVISGDMVETPTAANYAALARELSQLSIPYLPLPGNHDDRALMARHLLLPDTVMDGFVQYEVAFDGARLVCLDTLKPGSDAGELCEARRDWLRNRLAHRVTPTLLFMHHPPMPLGLPMLDPDRLEDGDSLLTLLETSGGIDFIGTGHVHRHIYGTHRGMGFATLGSVLYQAPPPDPPWTWAGFKPSGEPPRMACVTVEGGVQVSLIDICPYAQGGPTA